MLLVIRIGQSRRLYQKQHTWNLFLFPAWSPVGFIAKESWSGYNHDSRSAQMHGALSVRCERMSLGVGVRGMVLPVSCRSLCFLTLPYHTRADLSRENLALLPDCHNLSRDCNQIAL